MLIDSALQFARKTALGTSGTGYQLVGDVLDLNKARDVGNAGKPLFLVVTVDTTLTSGGSATVQFILASDGQAAIAVDGTATEHFRTDAFDYSILTQGEKYVLPLPPEPPNYERYLGLIVNVGTAALTAGKVNAFLTWDPPVYKAYADNQK